MDTRRDEKDDGLGFFRGLRYALPLALFCWILAFGVAILALAIFGG